MLKPKTTIDEMIKLLESKNIKFKLISKNEAKDYLIKNNNYYNITSYKKNFVKYQMGVNKAKYLNLDFAYLKDLGIIDFRLRMILFKMINSIEHYLKLRILKYIELINEGATPQEARSILPNSLKTEIVVTMNLREWRHFFKLRTAPDAHPQMIEIAKMILDLFKEKIPVIFDEI